MADLTYLAFDLADKYRNPVMILADAILAQMMEGVKFNNGAKDIPVKNWAVGGARKRDANIIRSLYLQEGVLEEHNRHLQKKYAKMRSQEVRYQSFRVRGADLLIIAYGSMARLSMEVVNKFAEKGVRVGLFRPISLWPFPYNIIERLIDEIKFVLVVEMSEGQMLEDVELAVGRKVPVYFYGRLGGGVPTPLEIMEKIKSYLVNRI
jgi:2-oxoglutarate ferredoxin oxidoreductase subunit alpha